jgi:NhaP-type Na+/H+ and K+/H+ antiporter
VIQGGGAVLAATNAETARAFVEIGALTLLLAVMARVSGRFGLTAIPLYLLAGLAVGEGGVVSLTVSEDFVALIAEIGVLLLLLTLVSSTRPTSSETACAEAGGSGWSTPSPTPRRG